MTLRTLLVVVSLLSLSWISVAEAELAMRLRRPAALVVSSDSQWLYTANRSSGTLSVVNLAQKSAVAEFELGKSLSDLIAVDDEYLLALDDKAHQVVLVRGSGPQWEITARFDVAQFPVRVRANRAASRCYITSLWSRSVTLLDLSEVHQTAPPALRVLAKRQLPFEPQEMCLSQDEKHLVVAAAFGGWLAVLDADDLEPIAIRNIPGQSIRGLATSRDGTRIALAQQEVNSLARSTRDDVHWGNMISNLLVSFDLRDLCDAKADVLQHRIAIHLGDAGDGAGDPGPVSIGPNGEAVVLLSGVSEVAIGDESGIRFRRVGVGLCPSAAVRTADGRLLVADKFADSVSIVDLAQAQQVGEISLGPQPELTLAERGEMLFFDSRLSHDGWMSCHSCHTDGHTGEQLNDNFSDGSFDSPKRVLSLLGVGQTGPWAWSGNMKSLSQQVTNSIHTTMQGETPSPEQVAALVAYLETLPAPPTPDPSQSSEPNAANERGRALFESLECQRCHAPPVFTSQGSYDVGLRDPAGNDHFNPPSLRGVERRHVLFHDGRATSLAEVFTVHGHQLHRELTTTELDDLLQFLKSL